LIIVLIYKCFQSSQIKEAVYESDWLNLPMPMKKDLIIIMMRSQRALQIKVGVFEVSLQQFNKVGPSIFPEICSFYAVV
jgi:hypothetical protein